MELVVKYRILDFDFRPIVVGNFDLFVPDDLVRKADKVRIIRPVTPVPKGLTQILCRLGPFCLVGRGESLRNRTRGLPESLLSTNRIVLSVSATCNTNIGITSQVDSYARCQVGKSTVPWVQ